MAKALSPALRALLTATNLGRSSGHPLAGWTVLSMLYRDGSTASEPTTLKYLEARYNGEYLEPGAHRAAGRRGCDAATGNGQHRQPRALRRTRTADG